MPFDPLIPVAGTVRLDLYGRLYGQRTINIFAFKNEGAGGDVSHSAMAAALETQIGGFLSLLSTEWSQDGYRVYSYDVAGVQLAWSDVDLPGGGDAAGVSVPPHVALCVKKRSGAPGRQQRGRWYFAGLRAADHLDGEVHPLARAAFALGIAAWDNTLAVDTENFVPIIQTYAPSGNVTSFVEIQSIEMSYVLRNMRRRQIGVGI